MKDFAKICGKVGCDKPAQWEGYVGNLKVLTCLDHIGEVEGALPGTKPNPIEPSPADYNDARHHRLECQCTGCRKVQLYESVTTRPALKPAIGSPW